MTIEGVYLGLGSEDFIIERTPRGRVVTGVTRDGSGYDVSKGCADALIESADGDGVEIGWAS